MSDLQIFIAALLKVLWNFKIPVVYIIVGLAVIRRWEKLEKERMEEAVERDKLKRAYYQDHIARR